jgi:nitroreductase
MYDAGVASQTFCLSAYDKGIGSVILGIFDFAKVAELLEVPEDRDVIALIPIGYPDEAPVAPRRKAVEDLLSYK